MEDLRGAVNQILPARGAATEAEAPIVEKGSSPTDKLLVTSLLQGQGAAEGQKRAGTPGKNPKESRPSAAAP